MNKIAPITRQSPECSHLEYQRFIFGEKKNIGLDHQNSYNTIIEHQVQKLEAQNPTEYFASIHFESFEVRNK